MRHRFFVALLAMFLVSTSFPTLVQGAPTQQEQAELKRLFQAAMAENKTNGLVASKGKYEAASAFVKELLKEHQTDMNLGFISGAISIDLARIALIQNDQAKALLLAKEAEYIIYLIYRSTPNEPGS